MWPERVVTVTVVSTDHNFTTSLNGLKYDHTVCFLAVVVVLGYFFSNFLYFGVYF